ncbi:MAG: nucleotidyltransferase domain-containing protein [Desulfuromonadales bacterium]|nr:nucleotidyltransferase domain-containing protein [Desulfuromonadales bacterium]
MKINTSGLGDALFSKTQRQVLSLLFGNPDKSFYVKEIVRYAGVGIGSVQRELEKLSMVGLLTIEKIGNQKHYKANRKSPIFEELRGIVKKTFGLADVLRKTLDEFRGSVELAFVYGSVAKGTDKANSDVDVMIISDQLTYPEVLASVASIEVNIGRSVNPTIYTTQEFKDKIQADSSFVTRVISQQKIFLIGSEDDIPTV